MRLQPIVDRLKKHGLVRVYGAQELAGLKESPATLPAFFVVRGSWSASENRSSGVHDQQISEQFGVVILLPGAARREDVIDESLHAEEERVIDALAGWTHPDATSACGAARGSLVSADRHGLAWMVSFNLGRRIRKGMQ